MSALDSEFKLSKSQVPANCPQPTKGWAVTEKVFDSLQFLLIATCSAIVQLGSVPDPRQRPNIAIPRHKTDNQP